MSSTTASNAILTNSVNAIVPDTGNIFIGGSQVGGILEIGGGAGVTRSGNINIASNSNNSCAINILNGGATVAGSVNIANVGANTTKINIGSTTGTGQIIIDTANTNNTPASSGAIHIGTSAVNKTIRINSATAQGTTTAGDFSFITNNNQNTNYITTISNTTRNITIGPDQTNGILNLGTGTTRTATGVINIGNSTGLGPIRIESGSNKNTDADPAIAIGTSVVTNGRTIKVGNTETGANVNTINIGNIRIRNNRIDNVIPTTGAIYIGSLQTTGFINIAGGDAVVRSGTVAICGGPSCSSNIDIFTNTTCSGTFNVGTATTTTNTTKANILTGNTTGALTLGNETNTTNINSGTLNIATPNNTTATINILNGSTANGYINIADGSNSTAIVNILNGASSGGSVNIANGTGGTQTTAVNIGSSTGTGQINIQTANTTNSPTSDGAINIGTTSATKTIRLGDSLTTGTVTLGDCQINTINAKNGVFLDTISTTTRDINIGTTQTTGSLNLACGGTSPATREVGANVNIANQPSNSCAINIMNGVMTAGSVNIATGTGTLQSTTVNIGSGSTTGAVTLGNSANSIALNAPTTVKSIKDTITYFTTQTNTLTVADILASNVFGSTYSLANPTTTNDIITINLPTPTSAMEGMSLTFRKVRGSLNTSTTNWSFVCPTSSIVPTSLTAGATPTLSTQNVNSNIARFLVMVYSGTYYYFNM